jgi:two-component sensor histidine kinase
MRTLVVDNDLIFIEFVSGYLSSLGYQVDTARDGLSALDKLHSDKYDVLISDLVMPNIDGATLVHLVRVDPSLNDMRIIVVSAVAKEDTKRLKSLEADFCIGKGPFAKMKPHFREALSAPIGPGHREPRILGIEELYHRNITAELLGRLRQLEAVLQSVRDGVLLMTPGREITFANTAAARYLELSSEELLGKRLDRAIGEIAPTNKDDTIEIDRGDSRLEISITPIDEDGRRTGEIVFVKDVTQFHRDQEVIQEQLERQAFLLREIHHRVKNNLAAIAGYISLEVEASESEEGKKALQGVAAHVDAVMLAHQQLYTAANLSGAPVGEYLTKLSKNLLSIFNRSRDVVLETEIDDVVFGLEKAVPLGLTVAEIVTNSLKYGLSATEPLLRVELSAAHDGYRLTVRDNGPGFPADIVAGSRESLGLTLIEGLARQISGTALFYNDGGAVCEVHFS